MPPLCVCAHKNEARDFLDDSVWSFLVIHNQLRVKGAAKNGEKLEKRKRKARNEKTIMAVICHAKLGQFHW